MVTLNGGKTWSTPYTQPNQQVYRVDVDNQFPYNLYGNNQDLIGYKVPSASIWGGISQADVTVVGSGESGASVPHPTDPDIIYHLAQSTFAAGGCPIQRVNLKTGQWDHRNIWPMPTFGEGQSKARYRFNWHAPIVIDPFDEGVLYTAAEVVLRSKDEGMNWDVISPVLTKDDESKQQVIMPAHTRVGGWVYDATPTKTFTPGRWPACRNHMARAPSAQAYAIDDGCLSTT